MDDYDFQDIGDTNENLTLENRLNAVKTVLSKEQVESVKTYRAGKNFKFYILFKTDAYKIRKLKKTSVKLKEYMDLVIDNWGFSCWDNVIDAEFYLYRKDEYDFLDLDFLNI